MNGPILPFKQAARSLHRAVFDIKVHFERLRTPRQSPAKSTRGGPECPIDTWMIPYFGASVRRSEGLLDPVRPEDSLESRNLLLELRGGG